MPRNAPQLRDDTPYKEGQPHYRFHRGLPPPGTVSDADGPIARIGSVEWLAWMAYYQKQKRWFSAKLMEHYAACGSDWPVTMQWPPTDGKPDYGRSRPVF